MKENQIPPVPQSKHDYYYLPDITYRSAGACALEIITTSWITTIRTI